MQRTAVEAASGIGLVATAIKVVVVGKGFK
jgi:hypothetical protein